MDEYIERKVALKIIDSYSKSCTEEGKVVADAIRDIIALITPSCDVAPKSEVTKAKMRGYENGRRDAAKEIFKNVKALATQIADEAKSSADTETEFTYKIELRGKQIGALFVLSGIVNLEKKYT